jgi:uncharacterized protein (TIGR03032 family)
MPHSPRIHDGRLWVADSGTGRLVCVERPSGAIRPLCQFAGYVRGLAFIEQYAFVGLSKIRESQTFGGLPIANRLADLKCGIWVVDWRTGREVAFIEFQAGVQEVFDVQVLPGVRFPAVLGLEKDDIHHVFIVPSQKKSP